VRSPMPARASDAPVELQTDFTFLIDGQRVAAGASTLDVINPATGQVFARCPAAGHEELNRAVAAARRAFPAWREQSYADRAERISRFCQSLRWLDRRSIFQNASISRCSGLM